MAAEVRPVQPTVAAIACGGPASRLRRLSGHWLGWRPREPCGVPREREEVPMSDRRLDATALRDWAHTAVGDLITHTDEINRLNVFPVADADTGTNMLFTMRAALAEAESAAGSRRRRRGGRRAGRRSAARRARQLRGDPLADPARPGRRDRRRPPPTAAVRWPTSTPVAARRGAAARGRAGRGVDGREPVDRAPSSRCCRPPPRPSRTPPPTAPISARRWPRRGDAAAAALEHTPEQLDVLAEAGVVDAGGRGLLVLLDALTATI